MSAFKSSFKDDYIKKTRSNSLIIGGLKTKHKSNSIINSNLLNEEKSKCGNNVGGKKYFFPEIKFNKHMSMSGTTSKTIESENKLSLDVNDESLTPNKLILFKYRLHKPKCGLKFSFIKTAFKKK